MSDDYDFSINVPVRNDWSNVSLLVTSVQNCFIAMFANVKGSRTVAMVTGELLENAIKYGTWKDEDEHLRLGVSGRTDRARITVANPCDLESFQELQRSINWMGEFADAEAAFRARLLAIATTADPEISKLGIVRIAHEGRCKVSADYADGIVRVVAELHL
jgi:hypothetical protein